MQLALGNTLARLGKLDDAAARYRLALAIRPRLSEAQYNLGVMQTDLGRRDEAVEDFRAAIAVRPGFAEAYRKLAVLLIDRGEFAEGVRTLRYGLLANPADAGLAGELAWSLATCPDPESRNGFEAVQMAETICRESNNRQPDFLDTLAAAYAEAGCFGDAVVTGRPGAGAGAAGPRHGTGPANRHPARLVRTPATLPLGDGPMSRPASVLIGIALLALMAALMAAPIRQESATMDEPLFLATGYGYLHGYGFSFDPEQPPLAKMISAAPLRFMDVTLSPDAQELLEHRRVAFSSTRTWTGTARPVKELFSGGPDTWYYWPYWEGDILGQEFVYGGANDADKLLSAGRWMQVLLTLITGAVIFLWLRELAGPGAAVLGVALWTFNPLALAYGHLVLTDMGVTLGILLAVWTFGRFLKEPTFGHAVMCGLSCGGALLMKFTAVVLAPIFLVLVVVHWTTQRGERGAWKRFPVIALVAALLVLLVYAPYWTPAPWISAEQAAKIGVPAWFQLLRPVLVPPAFFKGLALQIAHAAFGHTAFLCGQWRQTGWWYYFPAAFFFKRRCPCWR